MTVQTLVRQETFHRQLPTQSYSQPSSQHSLQDSFLIIGYGNELRGDGAIGAQVAQEVNSWQLPNVRAIAVHQLLPELTTDIVKADYVIFVDACRHRSCALNVQVDPISVITRCTPHAHVTVETLAHHHSPQGLLSLTYQLYGYIPQAWAIQVPAERFGFGETLSSTARHGIDEAVQTIERFLVNYQTPLPLQCQ